MNETLRTDVKTIGTQELTLVMMIVGVAAATHDQNLLATILAIPASNSPNAPLIPNSADAATTSANTEVNDALTMLTAAAAAAAAADECCHCR